MNFESLLIKNLSDALRNVEAVKRVERKLKKNIEELFEIPPSEFGDLSSSISFHICRFTHQDPLKIAKEIVSEISLPRYVEKIEAVRGYINFFFDWNTLSREILREIIEKEDFGKPRIEKKRIMIEHTSVNPNKALHIGHVRNAVLGDSLARFLKFLGHDVVVANYIDDTGTQIADIILGFEFLGFSPPKEGMKLDHYCGNVVYVSVNKMYEENPTLLEKRKFILKKIEEGNNEIARKTRKLCEEVLKSQLQTLWRMNIYYDLLNWESDILHAGFWDEAFRTMKEREMVKYVEEGKKKGCWVLKLQQPEFQKLRDREKILVRSDGTVVYAGKDIAYAMWKHGLIKKDFNYYPFTLQPNNRILWSTTSKRVEYPHPKFNEVDISINVIDERQSYEQSIVKSVISELGKEKDYIHYAYGVVSLSRKTARKLGIETDESKQFVHMSGRKGWFVNVDDLLDTLYRKVYLETKRRHPKKGEEFWRKVSEAITISTIRYELLKYSPNRIITFDIEKAINLKENTAIYLLYTYARMNGVLRRAKRKKLVYEKGGELEPEEKNLVRRLMRYPRVIKETAETLRMDRLCEYIYNLHKTFNIFYAKHRIIGVDDEDFRLSLVTSTKKVSDDIFHILGMTPLERI